MSKKKNAELSRMWGFAGKRHWLTIASCILAGISTVLSIIPFVCIWFVIRDILYAMKKGDLSLAASSGHYAWFAVAFSLLSILLYFVALCCSHLAAFRTATNMKKEAMHHIVTLPLGYFSQNASGRLRKIIDDNAGLTEGFLAHQLPDLTGAVVMPVAVISLLFVFDWRLGICCLIPLAISVFFLKKMMGGDNADFMSGYMTALENMNKEAVEFVRGIPVVKVFQQTIYSFKNFHAAIEEYKKLGATVEECTLDIANEALAVYYIIACAEASSNLGRFDGIRYGYRTKNFTNLKELYENSRSEGFGAEVKRRIILGTYVLSSGYYDAYYKKAQKVRTVIKQEFEKLFEKFDMLLTPTSPTVAYKIGTKSNNPLEMYLADLCTVSVNIAGLPGISIPCGVDSQGMPIGLQLIGKPFDEESIIQAAYTYEQEIKFRENNKPTFKN